MSKKNVKKGFRLSNADLIKKTNDVITLAERDVNELMEYGVSNQTIIDLKDLKENLLSIPSDNLMVSKLKAATKGKNSLAGEVRKEIKLVMS